MKEFKKGNALIFDLGYKLGIAVCTDDTGKHITSFGSVGSWADFEDDEWVDDNIYTFIPHEFMQ